MTTAGPLRILHLVDSMDYCDGRARSIYFLLREQKRAGHELFLAAGGGDALDMLRNLQIDVHESPFINHVNRSYLKAARGIASIWNWLREDKPDLIHAHSAYTANLALRTPGVNEDSLVLTVHGSMPVGGRLPIHPGKRFIAVSEATKRYIVSVSGKDPDSIHVVRYGVEFLKDDFGLAASPLYNEFIERSAGAFVVGFFGRLVESKGVYDLIHALGLLKNRVPLFAAIAGRGPEEQGILTALQEKGIPYCFFGNVNNVRPLLERIHLTVLPSRGSEGLPIILIETGLANKAAVATNVDGVSELIRNDETGLLVPPNDPPALASAIERMANDETLRARCAAALRDFVARELTPAHMAEEVESVYRTLEKRK